MRQETSETKQALRNGYTTGACATATSLAAARLLLEGKTTPTCTITLPRGQEVEFKLTQCLLKNQDHLNNHQTALASTIKDAGDDPDVTHGSTVFAEVQLCKQTGVHFYAAQGVGIVTRDGLPINKGEPAINPIPRQMMTSHLSLLADKLHYSGGFKVSIGIENGESIAKKTMNPRLGIIGGLSILGTTGIVRPFSCSAYIASIQQGIDVAYQNGITHIAACTGSTSEQRAQNIYALPEMALIEMGDFVGAVFKQLRKSPVSKLSLVAGFGKLSKLANGHMDLHSRSSDIDLKALANIAKQAGADNELCQQIMSSNTSLQALKLSQKNNIPLGDAVCKQALTITSERIPQSVQAEIWAINKQGEVVGHAEWIYGQRPLKEPK